MALTDTDRTSCVSLTEKDYPVFNRGEKPAMLDVKWDLPMEEDDEDEYYTKFDRVHSSCGFRAILHSMWSSTFGALRRRPGRRRRKHAASQQSL